MGVLDLLFPSYCVSCRQLGSLLCASCFSYLSFDTPETCFVCNRYAKDSETHTLCKTQIPLDAAIASMQLTPVAQKLLATYRQKPYMKNLYALLIDLFYESMIQTPLFMRVVDTAVFVPMPQTGRQKRTIGKSHQVLLAKGLAQKAQRPMKELIVHEANTLFWKQQPREKKNRSLNKNDAQVPQVVLLIDDILSTKESVRETVNILKQNSIHSVLYVALAKKYSLFAEENL